MKNKAFTLIELLAVIVILAIIALIATPIILGIIKDARENAKMRSAELVYTGVEYAYTQSLFKEGSENVVDDVTLETIDKYLNVDNVASHGFESSDTSKEKLHIVTKDNVYCEVTKNTSTKTFEVTCGTKEDYTLSNVMETKTIAYEPKFTGKIYRNSNEVINNGVSIIEPWCAVVPGVASSCIHNSYMNYTFSSKEECETSLEAFLNDPSSSDELKAIAQSATCEKGNPITYETNSSNIEENFYLKHDVTNNIVTASYSCIRYTEAGKQKEACVKGVNPDEYGTYDGMSSSYIYDVANLHPTKNIAIIQSTRDYFINNGGSCS